MAKGWRLCSTLAGVTLLLGGCAATSTTSGSSGALPVTITSVTATLTPYNPTLGSAGIPAEEVDFTVGGSPSGPFVCDVHVLYSGHEVGSTSISTNPPTGRPATLAESVPVTISRATFSGTPRDATVSCALSSGQGGQGTTTTTTGTEPTTTSTTSPGTVPVPTSASGEAPPPASPAQAAIEPNAVGQACIVTERPGSSENAPQAPNALPSEPVAVDVVRIPGLNDPACQSGVVTAMGGLAAQLAADVNAAELVSPGAGARSCPADDGHGLDLVFRYAQPSEAIAISVALAGCEFITGLATVRWISTAVTGDLKPFVPASWF